MNFLTDKRLSAIAHQIVRLFEHLPNHADGWIYISHREIGKQIQRSRTSVIREIHHLIAWGYIEGHASPGGRYYCRSRYRLTLPTIEITPFQVNAIAPWAF